MRQLSTVVVAAFVLVSLLSGNAYSQSAPVTPPPQTEGVDPGAVKVLRRMTDHLSGLKQFSVVALNMREDMLISGHRVDYEVTSTVVVSRPNKLRVERTGHLAGQTFYYDGTTLTLYNPNDKVYASMPAPATIEETLDFGRESLGLGYPISDLVYRNLFPLLMQDVTLALMIADLGQHRLPVCPALAHRGEQLVFGRRFVHALLLCRRTPGGRMIDLRSIRATGV